MKNSAMACVCGDSSRTSANPANTSPTSTLNERRAGSVQYNVEVVAHVEQPGLVWIRAVELAHVVAVGLHEVAKQILLGLFDR
jgi:hypothetical protein